MPLNFVVMFEIFTVHTLLALMTKLTKWKTRIILTH